MRDDVGMTESNLTMSLQVSASGVGVIVASSPRVNWVV